MAVRTPPFPEYPEWTTSQFFSFIRSKVRAGWMRWPPKYECKNAAKRKYEGPDKRRKFEYQCAICLNWFADKEVEIDHLDPPDTLRSFDDLPTFVRKMYVSAEKLRCLCKPCHKVVTAEQRAAKKLLEITI